jgi:hypothetical protein
VTTQQGDLTLLDHPIAQQLLQAPTPARLAYVWSDGTPRVVPIGFHWNGSHLLLGSPPGAPKVKILQDGAPVAVTIDTDQMPHHVLMIRGRATTDITTGIAPEYAAMCHRTMGDDGATAWLEQLAPLCPRMARITITPTWVAVLDFESRLPSAIERALQAPGA